MRINYVTIAGHELGSYRYQLFTPATELMKKGHEITFSPEPIEDCDVYVFHKHFRDREVKMIREVKGLKVYAISDFHFNTVNRKHYSGMCQEADLIVCATNRLSELVEKETGKKTEIIFDPWGIEFCEQKPNYSPHGELIALWFGHMSNIKGLQDNIESLRGCRLMIVSNADSKGIIPYSIDTMKIAFERCDFVVIPQDINEPGKQTKTHNRIVDSFRAGKFVIASPVDSYLDFKDWAYIGDIKEGVEWLKRQSITEIETRILKAQEYIRKTFSPEKIADQWETAFMKGLQNG